MRLCKLTDFKGQKKIFEIDKKKFLLIKKNEKFYFIDSVCKHMGGPLEKGVIEDNTIQCPWHGCKFDFITGKSINSIDELETKEVFLENGYICI